MSMTSKDFTTAHEEVCRLCETFGQSSGKYNESKYNEMSVRNDFLDKFFVALGWDVYHEKQTNPYEQEVKVEQNVRVASRVKKADYAFYIKPNFRDERFFVEAKKPSTQLDTPDNCFQTIRYAYSSSRSALSILTNFKEFYIIDCRFRPDIKTAQNHIYKKFSFEDFKDADKFGEVFYLFGREAVADGSLERYAETLPKPKGKVKQRKLSADGFRDLDDDFLAKLEEYRTDLAKMFKRKNPLLNSEDLTEATQRTLDRLVFIRFLEDKLIESSTILDKFAERPHAWKQFVAKSKEFDKSYNGIIFKQHAIIDAEIFETDDRVFLDICDDFASKYSPYHFNYIPIHILGSIYERFLGNVIVATAKQARVEAKPEVRKAGGVFYTPEYIVNYIVENTVGKLIEKKTPKEVAEMRFADIACGSGSFLLGVFDYLLRWHTSYYNTKGRRKEAKKDGCIENDDGTFHLSFEQKREILLNNIYGTDIDRQAFEVTQLSLFLKLLEDETLGSTQQYLGGFREALLPTLSNNIVCGNALVDWDVIGGDLLELVDEDKQKKFNPMSFSQKFPEIMNKGGFDAIVGNPPYGMITESITKDYFTKKFVSTEGRFDNYELFIEKAITLCNTQGYLGYIIPSPFLTNIYTKKLRRFALENTSINQIVNFKLDVFADPTVHTCIIVLNRNKARYKKVKIKKQISAIKELKESFDYEIEKVKLGNNDNFTFDIFVDPSSSILIEKLERNSNSLGSICYIRQCIKTGNDKVYVTESDSKPDKDWMPSLRGKSIGRYLTFEKNIWLHYGDWLARNWKNKSFYETPKIAIRETGNRIVATLDFENRYFLSSLYAIYPINDDDSLNLNYLLAIINSNLAMYFIKIIALNLTEGAFTKFRTNQLARLPIKIIDIENNPTDKARHDELVSLVEQIMEAKVKLNEVRNDGEREFYENKCSILERNIDRIVYQLYELDQNEIDLIENS